MEEAEAIGINLAEMPLPELDEKLRQFYAKARRKDGRNDSRATLFSGTGMA